MSEQQPLDAAGHDGQCGADRSTGYPGAGLPGAEDLRVVPAVRATPLGTPLETQPGIVAIAPVACSGERESGGSAGISWAHPNRHAGGHWREPGDEIMGRIRPAAHQ